MEAHVETRRLPGDREATILLVILAVTCASPGVRAVLRGEAFDVPTSAAFALAILSSFVLAIQCFRRAERARGERAAKRRSTRRSAGDDRSDGGPT